MHKNNIRKYLAGRSVIDISELLNVTPQFVHMWINGTRKPHELRIPRVLAVLGEPWGRVLTEEEVWPKEEEGSKDDIQN